MRKHILLKFKDFLGKCEEEDKRILYDVLSALRGPDSNEWTGEIKQVFTCKIRSVLGFHPVLDILPRKHSKRLVEQLKNTGGHWKTHVDTALSYLEDAELISTKYGKFMEKITKILRKEWELENKKTSQVSGK